MDPISRPHTISVNDSSYSSPHEVHKFLEKKKNLHPKPRAAIDIEFCFTILSDSIRRLFYLLIFYASSIFCIVHHVTLNLYCDILSFLHYNNIVDY